MKTKSLFLVVTLMMVGTIFAQSTTFVAAPANNGATTGLRAPNGTAAQTTLRAHFIIPASELAAIPIGTVITDLGVNLSSGAVGVASGNLHFYLENTSDVTNTKSADWAIATAPMSTVYNGTFVIPTVAGTSDFAVTNSFIYSGGGVYVAYEYIGTTFATTGAIYLAETSITGGCRTGATANNTPLATLNAVSDWRPEIRFGYLNPFTNDMGVTDLMTDFGKVNKLLQTTSSAEVTVKNSGSDTVFNRPVTLSVTGTNTFMNSQTIASLAPGHSQTIVFNGIPVVNPGTQVVQAYVPSDQLSTNDTLYYTQDIYCDTLSYSNNGSQTGVIGWGATTGIIACKYDLPPGLLPLNIKTIDTYISSSTNNLNNTIKGLLLNSNGVILDSSILYTISASDLGTNVSLSLINGNVNYAGQTVFLGIRQTAVTGVAFSPVGTQDHVNTPDSLFCSFGPSGGVATYYTNFDAFMIGGTVKPSTLLVFGTLNGDLCLGNSTSISIYPPGFNSYSAVINLTQVQTNNSGNFTIAPLVSSTVLVEAETNGCYYLSNSININVVTEFQSSISASVCAGSTYNFYGQSLSAAGQYVDTVEVPGSCDTIVTLNLTLDQATSSTTSATICEGSTYAFNNLSVSTAGTFTDVIPNAAGCDSNMTLNITLFPIDATITQNEATLTVTEVGPNVTYQWLDCNNGDDPIPGEISQSFTPTAAMGITGDYAAMVFKDSCSKRSDCATVDFTGLNIADQIGLSVYPIPVIDILNISTNLQEIVSYTIYDMKGKMVLNSITNANLTKVDVSKLQSGTYLLELNSNNGSAKKVFVKQ